MALSTGQALRKAREVRGISATHAARAAGISPAYLNRLENDTVKRPSPLVLDPLSEVLAVPYVELMRLSGYRVPGLTEELSTTPLGTALFADLTDDERDELVEYLAWYRSRRRTRRSIKRS